VVEDESIFPLRTNPTIANIRFHDEEKVRKPKAMSLIQNFLADCVFYKIIAYKTGKEAMRQIKRV